MEKEYEVELISQTDYYFFQRLYMATEAQKKARNKYNKANMVNKTVGFNKTTDSDILDYIEGVNFTGLVKNLIRKEMKKYKE